MNNQSPSLISIRPMQESDFPACQRLRKQAGWNQTLTDWKRFLSGNPPGCFVAVLDNQVVGTACTIPYENRFGWVAMVIVDQEQRRKGIGKRLLLAGIEHLENRGLTVKLDATPEGKMLYDTLGFHDEYGAARMESSTVSISEPRLTCQPLTHHDLDALDEYDRVLFGASRKQVLQSYIQYYPEYGYCFKQDGSIHGYVMAREGTHAFHIGPWVAETPDMAESLFHTILLKKKPQRIFVDILEPNPHVRALLESIGFHQQRPFIRMYKGINAHPGIPHKIYSLSGPELG